MAVNLEKKRMSELSALRTKELSYMREHVANIRKRKARLRATDYCENAMNIGFNSSLPPAKLARFLT